MQLEDMAKQLNLKHFGGVVMSDQIHQFRDKENISFILNFQDSTQRGRHWVLFYKRGNEKVHYSVVHMDRHHLLNYRIYLDQEYYIMIINYRVLLQIPVVSINPVFNSG